MNYTEAVDYIETIPKFTVKHPPEHTRELLSRLGNPQEGIKIIHVAGTNGKGSVCAYLNAMLLAGGKKTGLFTSPHLVRINERFQINGEDVSDEQFLDAFLNIGVDAPDFNLSIEEKVRASGIPVVHMVAPAVWAWRPQRIHQIKRAVDHLLLVFPFEEKIFKEAGIPSTYIGHPLAEIIPMVPDTEGARRKLNIAAQGPVIAILPGSRKDEIRWCAPAFFGAASLLLKQEPRTRFIVPAADEQRKKEILEVLNRFPDVKDNTVLLDGKSHLAMEAADAILVASGTATLEAALYKKPLVVGYAMPTLSAMLILSKGQTKWISLPNILAQKTLVPECVQMFCSPEILSSHLLHALEPKRQEYLKEVFSEMHETLLRPTAQLATEAIDQVLKR